MTQLYISPIGLLVQQLSNLGVPLAGGLVNIYQAGTVNTLQDTWTDSTGTTKNANPIVLNSAGRLAASNAPVSVWVPTNTPHKMVLTDSAGVLLSGGPCMDNLFGINDPIGLLTVLENPATGSGADLVANAMRSYDVFASLRAANVPSLASGQTLVVNVEGGVLVNDSNGGTFFWSPTSTTADDGATVIKPNALTIAQPGRYLRQTNLFGTTGTFNLTVQGCTTAPVLAAAYGINGPITTVNIPGTGPLIASGTSFGMSGWPVGLRANSAINSPLVPAEDNGVTGLSAWITIPAALGGNSLIFNLNNSTLAWTGTGTRSIGQCCFSFIGNPLTAV
jgi:hypothetical protein